MALTKIGVSSIKDTFKTTISGSARGELSSSVHLRQVATTISGSLGANAAVIRSLDRTTISGSIPQALATNSSPTFAAGTITGDLSVGGTLTAQEVHTEFESASILFTSGSTRFGDDTTDTHRVTGSMDISGSLKLPHGDLIIQDNIDVEGDIDVNGTTNLDNTDIDGTLTVDGGNIVFNEDSADQDFRVESNANANMLFVDGGQNAVGIGTNNPAFDLHIGGNSNSIFGANLGSDGVLIAPAANNVRLIIEGDNDASITLVDDGASSNLQAMMLQTDGGFTKFRSLNDDTGGHEDNIIVMNHDNGNVGIGTNNPTETLFVNGVILSTSGYISQHDTSYYRLSSANGTERARFILDGSDLQVKMGGSEKVRIASDGNVGIGTDSLGDAKLTIDGAQSNDVGLKIIQGIAKDALFVDMNANDNAISVSSDATTARGLSVAMDSLTTGQVANFQSNASDNSSRFLVRILNDNPSATGAIGLYLQNDAASGAELISGYSDANHFLERLRAGHASYESTIIMSEANRTASPNFAFYRGQSDADGTPDVEFLARGDGVVAGDNAYSLGADYAEYFESKDGSSIPVGTTVKLDGEKIVSCSVGDTPIGVIRPSGASTAVGNTNWNRWGGKYLKDDYGAYLYEEYSATTWEEGDNKKYYHTDRIPSSVNVPSDAVVTSTQTDGSKLMRKRLNPNYSSSLNYVSREDRDEWNIVGLMGQIEMTKGQPTGSQWIKMKDISDTVELWFVK